MKLLCFFMSLFPFPNLLAFGFSVELTGLRSSVFGRILWLNGAVEVLEDCAYKQIPREMLAIGGVKFGWRDSRSFPPALVIDIFLQRWSRFLRD